MGIFGRLQASVTSTPLADLWYGDPGASADTFAGFRVSADSAMRCSTVAACVMLIADTLASLPLRLERLIGSDEDAKELALDHPLYPVLTWRPNPRHSRFEFVRLMVQRLALHGNAYAEQRRAGRDLALIPLRPRQVTVEELENYRLRYRVSLPNRAPYLLSQDDMLHLRDGGEDETTGTSRVLLARESIALAAAAEAMAAGYFKNDATGRLLFRFPHALSPEKRAEYRAMIDEVAAGWRNSRRPLYVDNGGEVTEIGGPDQSAFLVDPRNYQVQDICKAWRVWPYMIGHESKITWGTNIAETKQGYVDFTARPWGDGVQGALMRDLLTEEEIADGYRIRFDYKPLLKGDLLSTVQAIAVQRQHGLLSPNEGRRILDMNPRDDPGGDEYQDTPTGAAPNNPQRRATDTPAPEPPPPPRNDGEEARLPGPALIADAAHRIAGEEVREVGKRAAKAKEDGLKFMAWARRFATDHRGTVTRVLAPLAADYGFDPLTVEQVANRIETTAVMALGPDGVAPEWLAQRQDEVAAIIEETFRAAAALRRAA